MRRTLHAVFYLLCSGLVAAADNPNVIVIYTDDQGFGDASCYNEGAKFQTPSIDRLAREGVMFTDAHTSDTVCTPSRYGLLTGRYSWRTTLKKGVMGAEGKCLIEDGRTTIASMLRDHGYATAMVGKWHLGMDFPGTSANNRDWTQPVRDMPLDKGFEYFFGVPASLNYGVLAWFEGRMAAVPPIVFTAKKPNARHMDYRIAPPYQNTSAETRQVLGKAGMEVAPDFIDNQCLTRFTDQAIKWMSGHRESSQKPFFLYLPLTSPHYPVCPLPEFHGKGDAGGYGEFMIETDYHVGRILDYLDRAGIAEDTLVVFSSDNGPENSWRARVNEFGHHSNGIFREGKRSIYEGGHRVPFVVRWPKGIVNPGRKCDATICQTDVISTIAATVGVDLSDDAAEDSESFHWVLKDEEADGLRAPLVHHSVQGGFAIRHGDWKLVMAHGKKKQELYNLATDPSEESDQLSRQADVANRLTRVLTDIVKNGRTGPGLPQANDTPYWQDLQWMEPW